MVWLHVCSGYVSGALLSTPNRCLQYFRDSPKACVAVVLKLPSFVVAMPAAL